MAIETTTAINGVEDDDDDNDNDDCSENDTAEDGYDVHVVFVFSVFGNTGMHMILRGSVLPQTDPVVSPLGRRSAEFRSPTPMLREDELLVKPTVSEALRWPRAEHNT